MEKKTVSLSLLSEQYSEIMTDFLMPKTQQSITVIILII